jgi:hypothetical protein
MIGRTDGWTIQYFFNCAWRSQPVFLTLCLENRSYVIALWAVEMQSPSSTHMRFTCST